jgi:hypothetical protein
MEYMGLIICFCLAGFGITTLKMLHDWKKEDEQQKDKPFPTGV